MLIYIRMQSSMTQYNAVSKDIVEAPSHFYKLTNYIPTRGILIVRAGVTEFSFVAA